MARFSFNGSCPTMFDGNYNPRGGHSRDDNSGILVLTGPRVGPFAIPFQPDRLDPDR